MQVFLFEYRYLYILTKMFFRMTFLTKIFSSLFPAGQSTMPNSIGDPSTSLVHLFFCPFLPLRLVVVTPKGGCRSSNVGFIQKK